MRLLLRRWEALSSSRCLIREHLSTMIFLFFETHVVVNKVYYRRANSHKSISQRICERAKTWGTAIESGKILLPRRAISLHLATFLPSQPIGARKPAERMLTANITDVSFCHSTGRSLTTQDLTFEQFSLDIRAWILRIFALCLHLESLYCFAVNIYTSIRYRLGLLT